MVKYITQALVVLVLLIVSANALSSSAEYQLLLKGQVNIEKEVEDIKRDLLAVENSVLSNVELNYRLKATQDRVERLKRIIDSLTSNNGNNQQTQAELKKIQDSLDKLDVKNNIKLIETKISALRESWSNDVLLQARDYADKEDQLLIDNTYLLFGFVATLISAIFSAALYILQNENSKSISSTQESGKEAIEKLRKENDLFMEGAKDAHGRFMNESEFKNGLIYKNLAQNIYITRFAEDFHSYNMYLTSNQTNNGWPNKVDPGVLIEIMKIQQSAIDTFERIKPSYVKASWLFAESYLDLAFYKSEMVRFGKLNNEFRNRIFEDLQVFELNKSNWIEEEVRQYQERSDLNQTADRLFNIAESQVFVKLCIGNIEPRNISDIKESIYEEIYKLASHFNTIRQDTLSEIALQYDDDIEKMYESNFKKEGLIHLGINKE